MIAPANWVPRRSLNRSTAHDVLHSRPRHPSLHPRLHRSEQDLTGRRCHRQSTTGPAGTTRSPPPNVEQTPDGVLLAYGPRVPLLMFGGRVKPGIDSGWTSHVSIDQTVPDMLGLPPLAVPRLDTAASLAHLINPTLLTNPPPPCPVRVLVSAVDAQLTWSLRRAGCCRANRLVSNMPVRAVGLATTRSLKSARARLLPSISAADMALTKLSATGHVVCHGTPPPSAPPSPGPPPQPPPHPFP